MRFFSIIFCLLFGNYFYGQNFETFFDKGVLRIDFYLSGVKNQTKVTIKQLKKEPHFAGSKTNLIFPKYGTAYVQIKDKISQKIIYGKGLSPLFHEWQSLEIAQQKAQIFENVLQIPYPKSDIIFEFWERNDANELQLVHSQEIAINPQNIIQENAVSFPIRTLYQNAPSHKAIDLAIVAEGYTQHEMEKFVADTQRLVEYMFSVSPFDVHKKAFNIYAVLSPSAESGTDISGQGIYKNTLLNSHFYTFGTERYLTCPSLFTLADILSNVGYDQVCVLVNTNRYGGSGFYNVVNIASSNGASNDRVFVHEFGHGFVGLADEYFYENDTFSNSKSEAYLKNEPWEPNITTLANFKEKWANMVTKNTPIPTPRTSEHSQKVGVFEGGGYLSKGVYSPMQNCRMKSNNAKNFCPVCKKAIENAIIFLTK